MPTANSRAANRPAEIIQRVVALLSDPATYPEGTKDVERIETHISWVFLTDRHVYKLKKPVRFDFLDYSTPRRRRLHAGREIKLGRRLAPDVYLGVVPITARRDGTLRLGGKRSAVAHVVKMRRLPEHLMLDTLIREGEVPIRRVRRLIDLLVAFYCAAARGEPIDRCARPHVIRGNVEDNFHVLAEHADHFGEATLTKVRAAQLQVLELCPELFLERIAARRICEGHGDLRAEHVCMLPTPVVFDPVEFNRSLRSVDPIDELAFLAMECDFLGDEQLGDKLLRGYCRGANDPAPKELIGFYKSYRACVRGKVEILREDQLEGGPSKSSERERRRAWRACRERARRYLELAQGYCDTFYRPKLLITMGLMGTGKSTLATALAERLGMVVLRSDALRRELAGRRDRAAAYGEGIYSAQLRQRVYRELAARAEKLLRHGASVVLDATFLRRSYRDRAREAAARCGAPSIVVHCICSRETTLKRLASRSKKPHALSDARPELYEQQLREFEPPDADEGILTLKTEGSPDASARRALRRLRCLA